MVPGTDYPHAYGVHSLVAAICFAIIYVPFIPVYLWRSIHNPTIVHLTLTFFCVIRVSAFTIRAVLAGSRSVAGNLPLLVGSQIIYNIDFFFLLFPVNTLVRERELRDVGEIENPITFALNRHLRLGLSFVAIALGIVGTVDVSNSNLSHEKIGQTCRTISASIYLICVVLLLVHTLLYVNAKRPVTKVVTNDNESGLFGRENGTPILIAIVSMLLIREIFYVATTHNTVEQVDERLFYPLAALPELLIVILITAPGLVPSRSKLQSTGI